MKKNLKESITIGLLCDDLIYDIPIQFFRAVRDVAEQHDINFLYCNSKSIRSPFNYGIQANILFDLLSEQNVDGLIIASNLLAANTSPEELINLCHRYNPLPIISMGAKIEGFPSVVNDNFQGMYEAVSHLIEVHGHKRIAYVLGPGEHPDAQERYKAYVRAIKDHNLDPDPDLTLPGDFRATSGHKAVSLLIDQRNRKPGRDFHAVVAANDYMAIGVLMELQTRGIRVPEEIAVVGFDDVSATRYFNPTISTVHQSFTKMGRQAAELLIAKLAGKKIPGIIKVPIQFVQRHSCGCKESEAVKPVQNVELPAKVATAISENPRKFLQYLSRQIYTAGLPRKELGAWEQVYFLLCQPGKWNWGVSDDDKNETFGQHAWSAVGKASYLAFETINMSRLILETGRFLISTLDISELMNILIRYLPKFGIRTYYLVLYENPPPFIFPQKPPEQSRLVLAYNENGTIELPPEGILFPTLNLLPKEIIKQHKRLRLVIEALYFREEQIGFWMLDGGIEEEKLCPILSSQISSSLQGALLLKRFRERTKELAAANNEIQTLNRQLKDENIQISTEMDVARHIQIALLPEVIKTIHPDFEITARMITAAEVGGDYYDISLDREGTLWLGIGDVSGHGVTAGLIMMMAQTVHTTITTNYKASARDIVIMLNHVLFKNITGRMGKTHFMTFTTLKYLGQGRFQYAGFHLDLLIYRQRSGSCEVIETDGMWLNVNPDIRKKTKNAELTLEIGDVLILYTDGLTEVFNHGNKMLDIHRFKNIVTAHGKKDVEAMEEAIFKDVAVWSCGEPKDDMSLVLVKRIR